MFKRILPLVLVAACAAAPGDHPPPPESVIGTYRYSASGSVAGKFPWDAQSDLVLDRDGQFTLRFTVHIDDKEGGDTDSDEDYGSYYVEGDVLTLEPADGSDSEKGFTFNIIGNRLEPNLPWPERAVLKGFRIPDPVFVKAD
jgi:hypothetical protein